MRMVEGSIQVLLQAVCYRNDSSLMQSMSFSAA